GTVAADVATAVKNAKAGQVRYRTDKNGIIHCSVGKVGFEPVKLKENVEALLADLKKAKPSTSKGVYLQRVSLSTPRGRGLVVDNASLNIGCIGASPAAGKLLGSLPVGSHPRPLVMAVLNRESSRAYADGAHDSV